MTYALELRDISYRYPNSREWSLQNINCSVEKGKFVAIMGPNGAGKSTLCLCFNGLIPQLFEGELKGQVIVAGKDTGKYRVQTLAQYVGLGLQDPEAQIFYQDVWEDVSFGPCNFSYPLGDINERVNQALKQVRLNGFEHRNTMELSGGEKQRLAIAGLLALTPKILVLDEPTAELDSQGRKDFYKVIDLLRKEKELTVFMVEHSSDEVLARADEVIVLNRGQIAWQGAPKDLFNDSALTNKFGLRPPRRLALNNGVPERKTILGKSIQDKPIIEMNHVTYGYNARPVLQDVNLKLYPGEFVVLTGPNGSGKSTFLKLLNSILKPTQGEVIVTGKNTKNLAVYELAQEVGYLCQNPDHQIFSTTVEKEIAYGLNNMGISETDITQRINEVLVITGLEEKRQAPPFSLSRGERQLVAIASIIVLKPHILLIDEPTAGLDWTGVQKVLSMIKQLHEAGTTVIMISHDLDLVEPYASRVIEMREGQVWKKGLSEEQGDQDYKEPMIRNTPLKAQRGEVLRSLNARTKVTIFVVMVILAYLFQTPLSNIGAACVIAIITFWSGLSLSLLKKMMMPLLPILMLMFLVNSLGFTTDSMDTPSTIFVIGNFHVYLTSYGMVRGINFILRIVMMMLATGFLARTTTIYEIVDLLNSLSIPPMVTFTISTALRFIPALDYKRIQILEAQKSRGARLEEKGLVANIKAYIPIMVPLLIYSILLTKSLAVAMLNRGFGFTQSVTQLRNQSLSKRDYIVIATALLTLISVVYIK